MCSVTDNDYEESIQCMETKPPNVLVGASCRKCNGQKAEILLRVKDTYCRQCFLESFTHKFRAALGKSRLLKPNDRVLIAVSGSQSSCALIHLVKDGLDLTSPKRLQCIPFAVYIDEGAVLNHTNEERQVICNRIARLLETYDIPGYVASLDRCLDISHDQSSCYPLNQKTQLQINEARNLQLKSLFKQVKSLSSKEELLQKLRHKILVTVSKELTCSKVFVGDSATDLAVTIMSNLSLGRGSQLPLDVGICDTREKNVQFLRPMRDFLKKEIAFYNVFKNIESVYYPQLSTKSDPFSSIQKLTEKFIVELQNDFPSTVSTIFRTGDKLSLEGAGTTEGESCVLCKAPLDTSKQLSSSLQATEFSQLVSSSKSSDYLGSCSIKSGGSHSEVSASADVNGCCSENSSQVCCSRTPEPKPQILCYSQMQEWLCYGCRLIVKEMDSLDFLPHEILEAVEKEMVQKSLRNEIQDFLL